MQWLRNKSREGIFLRVWMVWTAWTWITLIRNMVVNADNRPVSFQVVHITLAVVSLAFAAGAWPIAKKLDRIHRAEVINRELVHNSR